VSRFSNLEFEEGHEREAQSCQGVLKDEAYYLAEAQRAFERADFEPGLRLYARALEENPRSATAWVGQVRMLIELGEYREAKAWAEKALEQQPNHPELLAGKAVALARLGELDEALAFSDAAIEERGNSPYLWLARADVLLARGERRSDYCLEKALGLAPGDWFVAWLAARIRMFYEQFVLALGLLQQAIAFNAGQFVLWVELGHCETALGHAASACHAFRQALDLNAHCQAAHTGLIRARQGGITRRMAGFWRRLRGR
jgi:tetratricopeptide (TPR) repeat protein